MTINITRLAAATAGLWALFALPITQSLPDTSELINFGFWFAILMYPAWVVFGWRWISNGAAIPFKLWGGLTVWALIASSIMHDLSYYRDFTWLPFLTTTVMLTLVIIFDGWQTFYETPRKAVLTAWRKPPVWLVLVAVMLVWLVVQTVVGMLTPMVNLILLACCGLAWVGNILVRK